MSLRPPAQPWLAPWLVYDQLEEHSKGHKMFPGTFVKLRKGRSYCPVWRSIESFRSPRTLDDLANDKHINDHPSHGFSSELNNMSTCLVLMVEPDVDTSSPAVMILTSDLSLGWVNMDFLQCVK